MKLSDIRMSPDRISLCLAILAALLSVGISSAAPVDDAEAVAIADLWQRMELDKPHVSITTSERADALRDLDDPAVHYLVSGGLLLAEPPNGEAVMAFVVTYPCGGFVVVTGDDRLDPVIVFDIAAEFRWDRPERNFLRHFLSVDLPARWAELERRVADSVAVAVHPNWAYLRSRLQELDALDYAPGGDGARTIYVYWDTALWGQGDYYNDEVIAHNGNINGIPTGCTATAIAIKMRFHAWPPTGNGSHGYTDTSGNVQYSHFVNYGSHAYDWANMPTGDLTGPNWDVATLMYHCGVSVDMDYEVGASGAWPSAPAMNTYFRYKGTIESTANHEGPIIASIRGGLPVVLSSSNHTVVACGYRDNVSPYFYLNCGWRGYNNGWYNLNQIPGNDPTVDRSYPYSSPDDYVYVDGSWAGPENGNIQTPFNTLAEGYAAVPVAGQLWIKTGAYPGMTFSDPMTIQGYEGFVTIGE